MHAIITGCSCVICMDLTVCHKQIEEKWRQQIIAQAEHEFSNFTSSLRMSDFPQTIPTTGHGKKVCIRAKWNIRPALICGFCSMNKQLHCRSVSSPQLDRMLVHRRLHPAFLKLAATHFYTWVKRGTVRVKCFAQEHNTMSPARARTQAAQSGDESTNHEATAPPTTAAHGSTKIQQYCFEFAEEQNLNGNTTVPAKQFQRCPYTVPQT